MAMMRAGIAIAPGSGVGAAQTWYMETARTAAPMTIAAE
jgi:hypothetical protein